MKILLALLILVFPAISSADSFTCAFYKARPNATFIGNSGNTSNLQKACERYVGGDCPTQEEVDAKIPECILDEARAVKRISITNNACHKINTCYAGIPSSDCVDLVEVYEGIIQSVASGSLTTKMATVKAIKDAAKTAIVAMGNYTTSTSVTGFDDYSFAICP